MKLRIPASKIKRLRRKFIDYYQLRNKLKKEYDVTDSYLNGLCKTNSKEKLGE